MGFENGWLARATLEAQRGELTVVNTLHYDQRGGFGDRQASLQALADRLRDDLQAPYADFFNSAWSIQPIVVTEEIDPTNPTAAREQRSAGNVIAGTRQHANEALGLGLCAVATLLTGLIGRSFRGRLFLPPAFSSTYVEDGGWVQTGSYLSRCQAFLDDIPREPDLVFGSTQASCNWVVYSRTRRARQQSGYANDVTGTALGRDRHFLRSRVN